MWMTDTKNSLRQHYRHLRRQISLEQQAAAAQSISRLFFKEFSPRQKNIAVYLAHDNEISLDNLIAELWQTECFVFLPVLDSDGQTLYFVRYCASTVMKKNRYNIAEPDNKSEFILPNELDIVLMPLVAFDNNGVRLGMGKGYYDKSFSFCRYPHDKPQLIGVAYQCQHYEALPTDEWDVPLDGVMTEKKLILLNESV